MKLTENVLKQTIKEVINEILGEDLFEGDTECPEGQRMNKHGECEDKDLREGDEELEEVFADPKTVSHALNPKKPAREKTVRIPKPPAKDASKEEKERYKKLVRKRQANVKENLDEGAIQEDAFDEEFDPIAASEALDNIAGVDDVKALDVGPVNEDDLDEQELPVPELPKVPDVKTDVPAAEKMTPPAPKAPAGQQTTTPLTLREQVSAKHNRIFQSLIKNVTKK
tara:strand:+ start:3540 stop:4217 length:678 start_codon:yes stop_codon:yes gene_type:complete